MNSWIKSSTSSAFLHSFCLLFLLCHLAMHILRVEAFILVFTLEAKCLSCDLKIKFGVCSHLLSSRKRGKLKYYLDKCQGTPFSYYSLTSPLIEQFSALLKGNLQAQQAYFDYPKIIILISQQQHGGSIASYSKHLTNCIVQEYWDFLKAIPSYQYYSLQHPILATLLCTMCLFKICQCCVAQLALGFQLMSGTLLAVPLPKPITISRFQSTPDPLMSNSDQGLHSWIPSGLTVST